MTYEYYGGHMLTVKLRALLKTHNKLLKREGLLYLLFHNKKGELNYNAGSLQK